MAAFLPLVGLGLSAWNAVQGNRSQRRADDLQARALAQTEREYAERAPLRQQGLSLLGRVEGDSGLPQGFGMSRANPFSSGQRVSTATQSGLVPLGGPSQDELDRQQQAAYFDNRAAQENGGAVSRMRAQMFRQIADASRNGGQR